MNRDMSLGTPQSYMSALAEFVKLETEIGGPDPHIDTLGYMMQDAPTWEERIWRAGCYAAGYNVPTAEVIWQHWPLERVLEDVDSFPFWIAEHWEGFGFRRERRAVRTREKFARCLTSIAEWTSKVGTYDWWHEDDYDAARSSTSEIYGLGRYVQLKLLEVFLRYCDGEFVPKDIWPVGGNTPRATLALLYPQHAAALRGNDSRENIEIANMCAAWTREEIAEKYDAPYLDFFRLQVALCEGGKAFVGRQYPGSTTDSELRYYLKVRSYWGESGSQMLAAREALFDERVLGEKNGWWDKRMELGTTLPEFGYLWSDLLYDYMSTTKLSTPACWEGVEGLPAGRRFYAAS